MNSDTYPLITIIIAVFNGGKTLQQCIDSVVQQTYQKKQLIVIDGGSTDGCVEILEKNNSVINYWISESDKGIYNAWNKGLLKSEGEWLCFLGADDYIWNAQVLECISMSLTQLPAEIKVAYGQVMLVNSEGDDLYLLGESWEKVKHQFKQKMCIPHQGVMHRKSLFEQHGAFDETFKVSGDYEYLLRELKCADAYFVPDIIFAGMRCGGVSNNPQNAMTILKEVRRAQRIHNLGSPSVNWLMALCRVYIRLFLWLVIGETKTRKALDLGRRIMGLPTFWTKV